MTGTITISLDFELGWGVIGNGDWERRETRGVYRELRPTLHRFLNLLDLLEISCMWAAVGAMIDTPEARDLSHLQGAYGEKARRFLKESETETHDGRDLLDMVLNARSRQMFGTHGYSHVLFNDQEQNPSVYRSEFERARFANESAGLSSNFFVFPENRVNHLEVVSEAGIKKARTPPANAHDPEKLPGPLQRAASNFWRPVSPVVETTLSSGLCLHAGSELINWGTNGGKVKSALIRRRNERALRAARDGQHIHFWLHPFDLVATEGLLEFVEQLLTEAALLRDKGHINFRAAI